MLNKIYNLKSEQENKAARQIHASTVENQRPKTPNLQWEMFFLRGINTP
jgi:hypothetical protein